MKTKQLSWPMRKSNRLLTKCLDQKEMKSKVSQKREFQSIKKSKENWIKRENNKRIPMKSIKQIT